MDYFSSLSVRLPLETLHISACRVYVCSCDFSMCTHLFYKEYKIHDRQFALTIQHQQGQTAPSTIKYYLCTIFLSSSTPVVSFIRPVACETVTDDYLS